ncbi:glycosyl transferase [Streptomyces tateyamensis]|uniref:Glycosyl transferase n=1 Tax=Streptomyces tateyamensis TaxID=565073 RepID=A0A2V4NRV6_9ACTN|nr:nucleotide disphospho-sugar-binding domain-containing protein [Streptomyces tateyamensis]PYC78836.1 glycosyl transferase [Streptomyces tateyamensis]
MTTSALRCLLVVPPLAGHVLPALALADELRARGHQVAWAGSGAGLRALLGEQEPVLSTGSRLFRPQGGSGEAAIRSLWEGFVVPYARFTRKALTGIVEQWRPDVLLVDQHTPAGALVARRAGLPWVTLAPSALELVERLTPRQAQWRDELLRALWAGAGLPAEEYADPRFSPALVLAFTGRALLGEVALPGQVALVGPLLGRRPVAEPFPWERLDPDRTPVLVSLGTLAADVAGDFHQRVARALAPLADRVQGIVAGAPGELPGHVLAVDRVPTLELLRRAEFGAVLCHGGMNTTCEALAHGVPVVAAPIRHDQPVTAVQLVAAGAGRQVDFATASPAELRAALTAVLEQPGYRTAAAALAADFRAAGGAPAAARRIEEVAA